MKILVISGSYNEHSLGRIYSDSFKKLGHEVIEYYDLDEMEEKSILFKYGIFRKMNWWRLQIKSRRGVFQKPLVHIFMRSMDKAESEANKELIKLCEKYKPDMLFVVVGRTIRKNTLNVIKKKIKCLLVVYNGDSYENMNSTSRNMLDTLPLYDIVFTWSYGLFESLYSLGAKKVEYLAFAYDESTHQRVNILPSDYDKYSHDVVFVGTWDKEREKLLSQLTDYDLGIWGSGWNKVGGKSKIKDNIIGTDNIDACEMSKIYQTSKICLNIMRPQNSGSHNMKTFEIPALGGFMLTNRSADHLRFFSESDDIACFESARELKEMIEKYIIEEKLRNRMSQNAHKKVKNAHSYLQRAVRLLSYTTNMK